MILSFFGLFLIDLFVKLSFFGRFLNCKWDRLNFVGLVLLVIMVIKKFWVLLLVLILNLGGILSVGFIGLVDLISRKGSELVSRVFVMILLMII